MKCPFCNESMILSENFGRYYLCNSDDCYPELKISFSLKNKIISWEAFAEINNNHHYIESNMFQTSLSCGDNILISINNFSKIPYSIEAYNKLISDLYKLSLYK